MTSCVILRGRHGERFVLFDPASMTRLRDPRDVDGFLDRVDPTSVDEATLGRFAAHSFGQEQGGTEALRELIARQELMVMPLGEFHRMDDPVDLLPVHTEPTGPIVEVARPTWVSLEFVHENGGSVAGTPISIRLPDGETVELNIDSSGMWRADDVGSAGYCSVRLVVPMDEPEKQRAIQLEPDDAWLAPDATQSVRLLTGQKHRVVVVGGSTVVDLVTPEGSPIEGERCEVTAANRAITGVSNKDGRFVAVHPSSVGDCKVRFPNLDKSLLSQQAS